VFPLLKKKKAPAGILGTPAVFVGLVIFMGYLFDAPLLYGGALVPVALTEAVALILLGVAMAGVAGREVWPLNALTGPY